MRTLPPARTEPGDDLVTGPVLYRIITAADVFEGASRHRLGSIDRVELRRGGPTRAEREGRQLTLHVEDASISSRHLELVRADGGFSLADLGSSHGTFVDDRRTGGCELADGATILAGTTFFRFAACHADRKTLPDDLAASASAIYPGLRSVHPLLTTQLARLLTLASSTVPLWIGGATGTGKELVARAIHEASGRPGSFVAVNCAAVPESLAESELFGYVKGAFSGADADKPGLITASDGGTLFLDEVVELSPKNQARLLRAIQEREVHPVGATAARPVDLRVVSATHADMPARLASGAFREDLHARLIGAQIHLPPLAERIVDLGLIVATLAASIEVPTLAFTPDATRKLLSHTWPRNIRELEQTLRRAIALSSDGLIRSSHLETLIALAKPKPAPRLSAEDAERREQLIALLAEHRGNVSAVARAMNKGRRQIQRWVERYNLSPGDYA
jgi:transcriptional regulator with PAS, ATPase and Fis domain